MRNSNSSLKPQQTPEHETYRLLSKRDYDQACIKASWYFNQLEQMLRSTTLFSELTHDFRNWQTQQKPLTKASLSLKQDASLLQKLRARHDLSNYLLKTVRYIFIRDLGKDLATKETSELIEDVVDNLIIAINDATENRETSIVEQYLYRLAEKRGVTSGYHWLLLKLSEMRELFDAQEAENEGMRKLVKIIAGVVMHQLAEDPDCDGKTLELSIRLGYCYGLTYPFIDDLLDNSPDLNERDKLLFNEALRTTLMTGVVSPFPAIHKPSPTLKRIYAELKFAFEYIKTNLSVDQATHFFRRAYIFFEAQAIDRGRRLDTTEGLSQKELFMPVMMKSAGCRLIARDLIDSEQNTEFDHRIFCFGIYNQFNDDIKDIFDDLKDNNLTPYSYFMTHHENDNPALSPYQYYWAVVYYLIHEVYDNEATTKALFLERCINAHRSLRQKVGESKYQQLRQRLLYTHDPAFDAIIDELSRTQHTDWFDKLLSQEVAGIFKQRRLQQQTFAQQYRDLKTLVESQLSLNPLPRYPKGRLTESANYALLVGGKRLRSVLAYYIGQTLYQFSDAQCRDMASMLEYMHSASLILDDLPSQDDASLRRGNPTLHVKYQSEATAELSAVYLMMRAVEVQSRIRTHPPQAVLNSLSYAANTTQLICEGQLEDLIPGHEHPSEFQLESIYGLKTGLALEAALVIPALLAEQDEIHITHLKQLARHIGMAFQIKDDLLDLSGTQDCVGKPIDQDKNKGTLLNVIGEAQATERMFSHYYEALDLINGHFPAAAGFLIPLLNFIIYRQH